MKKKLKTLISSAMIALTFFVLQIHSSQAAEERRVILCQPDGNKKWIKVTLGQNLSDLKTRLIEENTITSTDIFQCEGVDITPRSEKGWSIQEAIRDNTLFFKPRGPASTLLFGDTLSITPDDDSAFADQFSKLSTNEKKEANTEIKPSSPHTIKIQSRILTCERSEIKISERNIFQGTYKLKSCIDGNNDNLSIIFVRRVKKEDMDLCGDLLNTLLSQDKVSYLVLSDFPTHDSFFTSLQNSKVSYLKVWGLCATSDCIRSSFYRYFPKNLGKLILSKGYDDYLASILDNLPNSLTTLKLSAPTSFEKGNLIINYLQKPEQRLEKIILNLSNLPKASFSNLFQAIKTSHITSVSLSSIKVNEDKNYINFLEIFLDSNLSLIKISSTGDKISKKELEGLSLVNSYALTGPRYKVNTDNSKRAIYKFEKR